MRALSLVCAEEERERPRRGEEGHTFQFHYLVRIVCSTVASLSVGRGTLGVEPSVASFRVEGHRQCCVGLRLQFGLKAG